VDSNTHASLSIQDQNDYVNHAVATETCHARTWKSDRSMSAKPTHELNGSPPVHGRSATIDCTHFAGKATMSFLLPLSQLVKRLLPQASTNLAQNAPDRNTSVAMKEAERAGSALAAIQQRVPLLLVHGRAGTGKTTLIQRVKESGLRLVVVAPTGIAALTAGGQTIHSFWYTASHHQYGGYRAIKSPPKHYFIWISSSLMRFRWSEPICEIAGVE
jgi:hypothetical protein